MAVIVMADGGIAVYGKTASTGPLGGAETAFVAPCWHQGAPATQRGLAWDDVAFRYEALFA